MRSVVPHMARPLHSGRASCALHMGRYGALCIVRSAWGARCVAHHNNVMQRTLLGELAGALGCAELRYVRLVCRTNLHYVTYAASAT